VTQLAPHHATPRLLSLPSATVAVLDAVPSVEPRGVALLVPGYTGSKEDFAPILDRLCTAGYRVVAMDQPGQYQSPGPPDREAYTISWLGGVVDEVAAALGDEPVHLLGHSFGGLVARAAVLARPQRYRSLILLCSGPAAINGARRERMARLEPIASGGMAAVHAAMQLEAADDPRQAAVSTAVREFLRTRFVASSLAGLFGMADALRTEPDRVAELRGSGVPTLVCFGADDDAWDPALQRDMARRLGARLRVVENAGHSPAIDRPGETVAALTTFWAGFWAGHWLPGLRGE
jgi:pimeloyl-ACP methyl ester carboxylesterase